MTREEADFIGSMNMCDEISNEAYKKIMCYCEEQEPCEDCISRRAVLDMTICEGISCDECSFNICENGKSGCLLDERIRKLPSVTPKSETVTEFADRCRECGARYGKLLKQKTGHWIGHREHCENLGVIPNGLGAYEWCSNCDYGIDVSDWHKIHHNYCPNCGAKMTEPQESEE